MVRSKIRTHERDVGSGNTDDAHEFDCSAICRPLCSGKSGHEDSACGAFVLHHLRQQNGNVRHDQRWRERPRLDNLGSHARQNSGVVHAIVGSPTATLTPMVTAAQSAAAVAGLEQAGAIQTLARRESSRSYQG